ncbi:MAG: synthase subunit delta [Phycisphaerales bacterium]|nr:synthase subunit delta [Phycisphaerales bacterium]
MPHSSPISTTAAVYAKSLLELAGEQQQAWEVAGELSQLVELLDADPAVERYLANPAVGDKDREQLLSRALEGKVSHLVWNFVRVLNAKGRLNLLREIQRSYAEQIDERFGKVEVDVTVAQRLNDDELEDVRRAVGEALKRDAVVHQYVDESIIGGLVLRVQDKLIDTSVRAQLAAMKQQMLAARPKTAATF